MSRIAKTTIAITTLMLIACSKAESFEEAGIATLPLSDYCELRHEPDRYGGKIVRISAQIGNFGHGYYFDDDRCNKKVYENLLDDDRTAVKFFEPRAAELSDALERAGFVCCYAKPTSVMAVGRFTREYPSSGSDHMLDRTSFHFELFLLEPAASTTAPEQLH